MANLEQRFWKYVDKGDEDECWEWQAQRNRKGYGRMHAEDPEYNSNMKYTHRVSYELHKGEIPDGMIVCHSCDNPPCVNPNHLWVGTHVDNVRDRDAKGKNNGGALPGEGNGMSKLTEQQVSKIKTRIQNGEMQKRIAEDYPVGETLISRISTGHLWAHVEPNQSA